MKKILLIFYCVSISLAGISQKKPVNEINALLQHNEIKAQLEFIAADEMRGRDTGSPESDIAANYIAAHFAAAGIKQVPGANGYFQFVPFEKSIPAKDGAITLLANNFSFKNDFITMSIVQRSIDANYVFVGYGTDEELEKAQVQGKVVIALTGYPGQSGAMGMMSAGNQKRSKAAALGAIALIETVSTQAFPWPMLSNFFSQPRLDVKADQGSSITHIWMKQLAEETLNELKAETNGTIKINIQGGEAKSINGRNVIGMVEGSDPKLKDEYILLTSHYDHVGVTYRGPGVDSIYNGARDNGMGTVAMMQSAKYFAKFPPKRSVIFLAVTGEEKGLLGSRWYAEHPLIDHKKVVFNFNCDGAGYNDVTAATIIGLERTTAESAIMQGCVAFGLTAGKDPVPEQNLFDRSDNVNFAVRGIPAITFSPGLTHGFNEEIQKYYHQAADQTDSIDFDYFTKFCKSYVYAALLIANMPQAPFWMAGDKYEAAGKNLYGR